MVKGDGRRYLVGVELEALEVFRVEPCTTRYMASMLGIDNMEARRIVLKLKRFACIEKMGVVPATGQPIWRVRL